MNNRPVLRASRIFYLPSERDHKANDTPPTPGPNVRISPLAVPQGASGEIELRDCRSCGNQHDCMQSVMRKGPFALEVCEMQTSKRKYSMTGEYTNKNLRRAADRAAIVEAIHARKSFCMHDLHKDTGLHGSTITGHLTHLLLAGTIRRVGRHGKAIMYELVEDV